MFFRNMNATWPKAGQYFSKKSGIDRFLRLFESSKSDDARLIAWLLSFGVISYSDVTVYHSFKRVRNMYAEESNSLFSDDIDPFSVLSREEGRTASVDIERTILFLKRITSDLGLTEERYTELFGIAARVISFNSKKKGIGYVQGYDRFLFLSMNLVIRYCKSNGFDYEFVESLTSSLYNNFVILSLHIINLDKKEKEIEKSFTKIDRLIKETKPEMYQKLSDIQFLSLNFALPWKIVFFADIHNPSDLYLMWDQIIYYRNNLNEYVNSLCISHILQVPIHEEYSEMVNCIQHFSEWRIHSLLTEADKIYANVIAKNTKYMSIFIGTSSFVAIGAAIYSMWSK